MEISDWWLVETLKLASQIGIVYTAATLVPQICHMDLTNALRKHLIDFAFVYAFQITLWMGIWTFLKWPKISETLCSESFQWEKAGIDKFQHQMPKRRLRECTLLELATINFPVAIVPWGAAFIAVKQVDRGLQGNSIFVCLNILSEMLTFCMCSSSLYWVVLNQILFMSHICHTLDEQLKRLK